MNHQKFFNSIRQSLFNKMSQSQVDGINFILDAINADPELTIEHKAYMLATAYHETAQKMLPIEEYGKGKGRDYGKKLDIDRKPYKGLDHIYYGRGYVQLTWLSNYVRAKKELGIDFVNHPELALDPTHAANIMILGMKQGWFTGKKLTDYITYSVCDYVKARRIINGNDRAQLIAGYAKKFEEALRVSV